MEALSVHCRTSSGRSDEMCTAHTSGLVAPRHSSASVTAWKPSPEVPPSEALQRSTLRRQAASDERDHSAAEFESATQGSPSPVDDHPMGFDEHNK